MLEVYIVKGGSTMIKHPASVVPSYGAAYRRLQDLEHRYMCSLKLWISCNEELNGPGYFQVHIAGSGYIFDHIPAELGQVKARIIPAFDDPFASALWHALDVLQSTLSRFEGHLINPPSQ